MISTSPNGKARATGPSGGGRRTGSVTVRTNTLRSTAACPAVGSKTRSLNSTYRARWPSGYSTPEVSVRTRTSRPSTASCSHWKVSHRPAAVRVPPRALSSSRVACAGCAAVALPASRSRPTWPSGTENPGSGDFAVAGSTACSAREASWAGVPGSCRKERRRARHRPETPATVRGSTGWSEAMSWPPWRSCTAKTIRQGSSTAVSGAIGRPRPMARSMPSTVGTRVVPRGRAKEIRLGPDSMPLQTGTRVPEAAGRVFGAGCGCPGREVSSATCWGGKETTSRASSAMASRIGIPSGLVSATVRPDHETPRSRWSEDRTRRKFDTMTTDRVGYGPSGVGVLR